MSQGCYNLLRALEEGEEEARREERSKNSERGKSTFIYPSGNRGRRRIFQFLELGDRKENLGKIVDPEEKYLTTSVGAVIGEKLGSCKRERRKKNISSRNPRSAN